MEQRIKKPAEIAEATISAAVVKAGKTPLQLTVLGILAGMFIAFGGAAAVVLWGTTGDVGLAKFLGAAAFPVGIMLVLLAGSELFTGNNLMTLALMEGKISVGGLLKNWLFVYLGNLIGSIFVAWLVWQAQLWVGADGVNAIGTKSAAVATAKNSLAFGPAFFRAILCNMVVVLAVWMATAATTVPGKLMTLWFPISAFVISGYEHIVANMFFMPVGMFHGAEITWASMATNNFLPVTLGNLVGGAVIIPVMYWVVYRRKTAEKQPAKQALA